MFRGLSITIFLKNTSILRVEETEAPHLWFVEKSHLVAKLNKVLFEVVVPINIKI